MRRESIARQRNPCVDRGQAATLRVPSVDVSDVLCLDYNYIYLHSLYTAVPLGHVRGGSRLLLLLPINVSSLHFGN